MDKKELTDKEMKRKNVIEYLKKEDECFKEYKKRMKTLKLNERIEKELNYKRMSEQLKTAINSLKKLDKNIKKWKGITK